MNIARYTDQICRGLARTILLLALAALPQVAFAQTEMRMGDHVAGAGEEHAAMHATTPFDASESSEVGESLSVLSAESPTTITVSNFTFMPVPVTVPQGETVRWEFQDSAMHTATDTTGLSLFDSGPKSGGESFSFVFRSAGIYPYHCDIHESMTGIVQVPIQVAPATGSAATAFTITWSSTPAAAGFVFDVQIKRPGARSFVNWKMGQTKRMTPFKPAAGTGNYSFRARLRKLSNKAHCAYSPLRTITVQ